MRVDTQPGAIDSLAPNPKLLASSGRASPYSVIITVLHTVLPRLNRDPGPDSRATASGIVARPGRPSHLAVPSQPPPPTPTVWHLYSKRGPGPDSRVTARGCDQPLVIIDKTRACVRCKVYLVGSHIQFQVEAINSCRAEQRPLPRNSRR